ncbi:MAG: PilZ domain-containing protein [Candidatus Methylomirabilales bacterium]|nr:PilZ domain-containing protein [candidate division NC10 bacterium]MCZ6550106.1 PilZ domain-containing protein [candidate division NC10 bacterium]
MKTKLAGRRKYPRYSLRTKTKGRLTAADEVALIDISVGGVRIEHGQFMRPGAMSLLDLEFEGKRMRLTCRVVWSVVVRQEVDMDGEAAMVYHTGLEFQKLSEEARQLISDYLQAMIDEGKAGPPDDGVIRRGYKCQKCGESYQLADSEVRPVFMDSQKRPVQAGDHFYYAHDNCDEALECIFGGPRIPWTLDEEA